VLTEYSLSGGTIGSAVAQLTLASNLSSSNTTYSAYSSYQLVPTAINVLANSAAVYVTAYNQTSSTSGAAQGWVFGYAVGSGGALTPASASPWEAGVKPTAIASTLTETYVYVTDYANSQLIGYSIQSGSILSNLTNGPFTTGTDPVAVVIDPRDKYIYVANSGASSVSAYTIDSTNGTPSALASTNTATDTTPVAIIVDASLGRFVYTANEIGESVTGFRMDTDTGALSTTQASPYPIYSVPTALASIPHGSHSTQTVTQ
jgi:6-phosphogluconolactonase (cycloisomerase 2 family)